MRAELKGLSCDGIPDLETFHPIEPDDFAITLTLSIGPAGEQGEELLYVDVCTPRHLMGTHQPNEILIGWRRLIVFEYNHGRLVEFLIRYCKACEGETWTEVARKVGRLGYSEFDDYTDLNQ